MRVISGDKKGHKLFAPKGVLTRPTEDRIKENIFNIIGEIEDNMSVLDLYSGSGAIGIEFLSRGAKIAYFVDNSQASMECIKRNLEHTKLVDKAILLKKDVLKTLELLKEKNLKFHVIYLDPPFQNIDLYVKTLEKIVDLNLLSMGGLVIVERSAEISYRHSHILKKKDERVYGNTIIEFYGLGE